MLDAKLKKAGDLAAKQRKLRRKKERKEAKRSERKQKNWEVQKRKKKNRRPPKRNGMQAKGLSLRPMEGIGEDPCPRQTTTAAKYASKSIQAIALENRASGSQGNDISDQAAELQPLLSAQRSDVPLLNESTLPSRSNTANEAPQPVQHTVAAAATHGQREIVGNPVQQAVASMQTNLSGEQGLFPLMPQPEVPFTSINLPVDARVPMRLKTKIWQQECIDFGPLLVYPTLDGKFQLTIQNSNEGFSPALALEPLNIPKKISSIDIWLQAFHVFAGIYASHYPNEAPGLVKYGSTIQDLAARGHNWRLHDENFSF
ncbi:hypothetical protein ACROYT_G040638 [Oculina patagonica]